LPERCAFQILLIRKCSVTDLPPPLPSNRHHWSNGDCLEGKREIIRSVLCNIVRSNCAECNAHKHTSIDLTVLWIGFCINGPISLCLDSFLWPPYKIGQAIIFLPCVFFFLSFFLSFFFFSRLISAAADWMSAILPYMVLP